MKIVSAESHQIRRDMVRSSLEQTLLKNYQAGEIRSLADLENTKRALLLSLLDQAELPHTTGNQILRELAIQGAWQTPEWIAAEFGAPNAAQSSALSGVGQI